MRSGIHHTPFLANTQQKSPSMQYAFLGSGLMVSGVSTKTKAAQSEIFIRYSESPRIIKGWFKIHISYMGITNMIKNAIVMSTSPVNRVITKRGDT